MNRNCQGKGLQAFTVTVLILLARSAGTRIVASGLFLGVQGHRLLPLLLSGLGRGLHARSLQLVDVDLGALLLLALHRFGVLVAHGNIGLVQDGQHVAVDSTICTHAPSSNASIVRITDCSVLKILIIGCLLPCYSRIPQAF